MNQNNEFNDPKGQGLPPAYTDAPPPPVMNPPPVTVIQPPGVVYQTNVVPVPGVFPVVFANSNNGMGPKERPMTCVSCNQQIVTRVEHLATTKTHLFAGLLCLIGCWPCVCIPYCIDSCRNANHYCPNCNAFIGSYNY